MEGYLEPNFLDYIKGNMGAILTGCFTIVGVLISVYFGFENWKGSEKEKFEKGQLDKVIQSNTEELKEKTGTISELQEKVVLLQGVALQKMEHQINTITGGDSYPVIYLSSDGDKKSHIYSGTLFAAGNYPLKNLSMKITTTHNGNSKSFPETQIIESLRQMTPTPIGKGGMVDLSIDSNAKILIRFIADNGTWIERVQFREDETKGYQYKIEVIADQQPDIAPLVKADYGESVPIGTIDNWKSTQYKTSRP